MNIGNKTLLTIGETASLTELKQTVLRFWEEQFDELKPIKNKFGHRLYTEQNIKTIETIKKLLYIEKLTIEGAKKRLAMPRTQNDNIANVKKELFDILTILRSREK